MLSSVQIVELDAQTVLDRKDEIERLWRLVFPATTEERFAEILPRHVERRGFRFLAARNEDGELVGFAYGYQGGPGEWWHDRVATALGPEAARRWLTPGHLEFVELQVHPDLRGRGLGGRLHDQLLGSVDAPTAVLSTEQDNEAALGLYLGRGWELIVDEILFGPEYPPFVVLGKDLG